MKNLKIEKEYLKKLNFFKTIINITMISFDPKVSDSKFVVEERNNFRKKV